MSGLRVLQVGPVVSVQDMGRPGLLERGISQGGAADVLAVAEGAALLRQPPGLAALEMGGMGGTFEVTGALRIALTGAPMGATLDGVALAWNASHQVAAGQKLVIGAARRGVYGYLHLGGGIATDPLLGSRAVHLMGGIGRAAQAGDLLPAGPDAGSETGRETGLGITPEDRFSGGVLRIVESFQSSLFPDEVLARFGETAFRRGGRANRMGVEMISDGAGFSAAGQLKILSEVIAPGDVQMTGDGKPFVLLRECQTTGGYPRIGTVLPCDLARVAQAGQGAALRFDWVTLQQGLEIQARYDAQVTSLPSRCAPLVRDPAEMADLLSYQLISGVVSAGADPFDTGDNK